jgi:hypothetical protein
MNIRSITIVMWSTVYTVACGGEAQSSGDDDVYACRHDVCILPGDSPCKSVAECGSGSTAALCCFGGREQSQTLRGVNESRVACINGVCNPTSPCVATSNCAPSWGAAPGLCVETESIVPGDSDETTFATRRVEEVCAYHVCRSDTECHTSRCPYGDGCPRNGCVGFSRSIVRSLGAQGEPPAGTRYEICLGQCLRNPETWLDRPCTPGAITILEEPATPTAGR